MKEYHHNKIHTYYNNKQITSPEELPVPFKQRTRTDLFCIIFPALFALAMFITACVVFNGQKLGFITYPTDGMGRKCTLDNPTYNYLYFTSFNDPTKRLCVSSCPSGSETQLNCLPTDQISCAANNNTNYEVQIYPSTAQNTGVGLFCFPTDETLKQRILYNSNLQSRFTFLKSYRSIWISAGTSFGLGLIFLIMMTFATRPSVYISIAVGGVIFIGIAILLIVWNSISYKSYSPIILVLAVLFLLFGCMLLSSLCFKTHDIHLCSQYLKSGIDVLTKKTILLLSVPIFMALTVGLIALCLFQLLSFWSYSSLVFHENQIYYQPEGTFASVMQFLDLVQFIWGLCFLSQAFNFIGSACAVTSHFSGESIMMHGIKGLLKYHWGSVVASSFFLNFFLIPDLIYDFVKPNQKKREYYKCFTSTCFCCERVFGFARSETMAFINAVGQPYCNSSRWCERVSYKINYFEGSQSVFRYFSLGSHIMLASIGTLLGFLYSLATGTTPNELVLAFSFVLNIFVITYFVSLAKNLGQSEMLATLIEKFLLGQDMIEEQNNNENNESSEEENEKNSAPSFNQRKTNKNYVQESNVQEGYLVVPTQPY